MGRSALVEPISIVYDTGLANVPHVISWVLSDLVGPFFAWKPAFYFRLAGVLWHVLAATALVWLAVEVTGRVPASLTAGLLFLVHPLASEPVIYIAQRYEVQATLLMFMAAAAYIRFRRTARWWWAVAVVLLFLAAIHSKVVAYVLPIWLGLIEVTFFPLWRSVSLRVRLLAGGLILTLTGAAGLYRFIPSLDIYPIGQYVATQGPVLAKYMQLAVAPVEQFLVYDFPLVQGLSLPVVCQWLLVLAFLAGGLLAVTRNPVVGFGILTFFVLLSPTTLIPQGNLIFEYRAYGALGGLAIAAGVLLIPQFRLWKASLIFVLIVAFGIRTHERSGEWNDPVAFYEAHRRAFPGGAQALTALAIEYSARGQTQKALQVLLEARANEGSFNRHYEVPGTTVIALNLVAVWTRLGNLDAARRELDNALDLNPYSVAVRQTEARYYMNAEQYESAANAFELLTEMRPDDIGAWLGLRDASARLGNEYEARAASIRATFISNDISRNGAYAWRIPERFGIHTIFFLAMLGLGVSFATCRWLWVAVRPELRQWLRSLSCS